MSKTWYGHHIDTIKGNDYVLFKDYLELDKIIEEKDKEIERLNNIINELEKYIKENSIYYNTSDGCQWVDQFKVLDKLKELKEGE